LLRSCQIRARCRCISSSGYTAPRHGSEPERPAALRLLVIVEGNATPILIGCDFDELSYNVLHNQILKATMLRLLRKQELAQECSDELAKLARQFSEIHDIQLSSRVLGQVQLQQRELRIFLIHDSRGDINGGSVMVLLPARSDLLRLVRVGCRAISRAPLGLTNWVKTSRSTKRRKPGKQPLIFCRLLRTFSKPMGARIDLSDKAQLRNRVHRQGGHRDTARARGRYMLKKPSWAPESPCLFNTMISPHASNTSDHSTPHE
jgi:hypothetical protein